MAASVRNKILVLNAGSSSLKFKLFQLARAAPNTASGAAALAGAGGAGDVAATPHLLPVAAGLCERIGDPEGNAVMRASAGAEKWRDGERVEQPLPDHGAAMRLVTNFLSRHMQPGSSPAPLSGSATTSAAFPASSAGSPAAGTLGGGAAAAAAAAEGGSDAGAAAFEREVLAVGHRVVHGGSLSHSVIVDEAARASLEEACQLAPLHNPPSLHCLDAAQCLLPHAPHVAVFDTSFHQTMPPEAYTYALPTELCQRYRIRRYGFHGISYEYLTREAARMLGKPSGQVNLILCHLGAGSSMCAVRSGLSVDTSMGFTPLEGLVMGSRCGDIDPAIVPFLIEQGMTAAEVQDTMNRRSGFLGMTGSIDVRGVEECALEGDERCQLALAVFVKRCRKYLGSYLVTLGGRVDAIVFSAGIGENGAMLRDMICADLAWAGLEGLDPAANEATIRGKAGEVQAAGSTVKVLVLPTDEQLEIAEQTLDLVWGSLNFSKQTNRAGPRAPGLGSAARSA